MTKCAPVHPPSNQRSSEFDPTYWIRFPSLLQGRVSQIFLDAGSFWSLKLLAVSTHKEKTKPWV